MQLPHQLQAAALVCQVASRSAAVLALPCQRGTQSRQGPQGIGKLGGQRGLGTAVRSEHLRDQRHRGGQLCREARKSVV
jgi:hypothetical protein